MATNLDDDLAEVRALARSGQARAIREQAGWTLRQVADAAGVTASAVWRYEQGRRRPSGVEALRYLAVLRKLINGEVRNE